MTEDWKDYEERDHTVKYYKCPECRSWNGKMKRRKITEPSGDFHKEYKIVCNICKYQSTVHFRKSLTEKVWVANGGELF